MDKHNLPEGILWRRVYEISGGAWQPQGASWSNDAFAYYLSIACNHCEKPICVEVCPTRAIIKRPDGIVLIDAQRCIGCQYCSWACPYGALQYDPERGCMTKCTFCADLLEIGEPPACITACPLRALDFGERAELEARYGKTGNVFPLPHQALTEPALLIRPHQAAKQAIEGKARIANAEEINHAHLQSAPSGSQSA
jgi:anaerobic dimethyl sulfoxide reductase subunit B (iron-sulfur subunit)